jgi:osmotically-inducible protein OsmY
MKTFVFGILVGVIIAGAALWYFTVGKDTPAVQRAQDSATAQAEKAMESTRAATEQARQALTAKLEALDLRPEDIRKELAKQGRVLRRKARDMGEAVSDAALDTRATAVIKTKLAADPDFSALSISVATTGGRVTLSGKVASPELIGKAIVLALETEGVREVISTIQAN